MKNIFLLFKNRNPVSLPDTDLIDYTAVKYSRKAYILTALVLLPVFVLNYMTMIWSNAVLRQNPTFSFQLLMLPLMFPIAFGVLILRELIRCRGYSAEEKKYIKGSSRFRGAVLVTYCTEKLKRDRMIWVKLLPNVCVTLPLALISFFFRSIGNAVISMFLSGVALMIIASSVHDLLMAVSLLDYEKESMFCVNRDGNVYMIEEQNPRTQDE